MGPGLHRTIEWGEPGEEVDWALGQSLGPSHNFSVSGYSMKFEEFPSFLILIISGSYNVTVNANYLRIINYIFNF